MKNLKQLMKQAGLTRGTLAEACGLNWSTVHRHLTRERGISLGAAKKYSAFFRLPLSDFIDLDVPTETAETTED